MSTHYAGLDLLATAVVVLDERLVVRHVNTAAEQLLQSGRRSLVGAPFTALFVDAGPLIERLQQAQARHCGFWDQNVVLTRAGQEGLHLNVLATPVDSPRAGLLLELRSVDQQLRIEREVQLQQQHQAHLELIRNLAHEIRNPLGGLRGAAQLLQSELESAEWREYTQVIVQEADRLQGLLDRLLTPHRPPCLGPVNIHAVLEHVCTLMLAEFPAAFVLQRDYDASLPEVHADREQLIQIVLNIVRNAAQAVAGQADGEIRLRTRIARAVLIARRMHRLALELLIEDNGPGIPPDLQARIFDPLVSGREGGAGLGLMLAQTYVQLHQGRLECESVPGRTAFRLLLPFAPMPEEAVA